MGVCQKGRIMFSRDAINGISDGELCGVRYVDPCGCEQLELCECHGGKLWPITDEMFKSFVNELGKLSGAELQIKKGKGWDYFHNNRVELVDALYIDFNMESNFELCDKAIRHVNRLNGIGNVIHFVPPIWECEDDVYGVKIPSFLK